jgi:hypothetical protein
LLFSFCLPKKISNLYDAPELGSTLSSFTTPNQLGAIMTEQQNVNQTLEQESEVEINHWVAAGAVITAAVVGYATGYFGVRWLLSKMNQQD